MQGAHGRFGPRRLWRLLATLPALLLFPAWAAAADDDWERFREGLYSSFSLPWHELRERDPETGRSRLLRAFSGSFGVGVPLDWSGERRSGGRSQGARQSRSPTLQATLRFNPLSSWFVSATAYRYLHSSRQQDWDPDFSYSFGYDDPRPYTLSLVYSNYGGNRFAPRRGRGEQATAFSEGTWSFGWKFPVPEPLAEPIAIDRSQEIVCRINGNLTPRYYDARSDGNRSNRVSASLGCRYPIWGQLHLDWTAHWYPKGRQQQPWDPDFTYEIGYYDWSSGGISLVYQNYSGNRFPWRSRSSGTGRFVDGTLLLRVSWGF